MLDEEKGVSADRVARLLRARMERLRVSIARCLNEQGPVPMGDSEFYVPAQEAVATATVNGRILEQCERALARIEDGHFGICEDCGSLIPTERIIAVPGTTRCVECQKNWESKRKEVS